VEKLTGDNFAKWSRDIQLILVMMDKYHSMRDRALVAPVAQGTDDTTLAERTATYEKEKECWERSDRIALMVMDFTISLTISPPTKFLIQLSRQPIKRTEPGPKRNGAASRSIAS